MATLNCDDCDNAGCLDTDDIRERVGYLVLALQIDHPDHFAQGLGAESLINELIACPISAGEAVFQLARSLIESRQLI